jgi:hypothetical protein
MQIAESRRRWSTIGFLVVLALGLLATTIAYKSTQTTDPGRTIEEQLTERHKELIATERELAKWLMGIASGTLAAIVSIRLKSEKTGDLFDLIPMVAYAFLLNSLYGGFLSYEATLNVLRVGPLGYLYGDQMRLPILVQFWSLIAGLTLLSVWLFRRKGTVVAAALLLLSCSAGSLHGATVDDKQCVEHWAEDRKLEGGLNQGQLLDVVHRVGSIKDAKPLQSCEEIEIVLDELRFESILAGNKDGSSDFNSYVKSLQSELSHPDLSTSDIVRSLVRLMAVWEKPFGVLSVRSAKGSFTVLIDGAEIGVTNWIGRLEPGVHRVRVVTRGVMVYSSDTVSISAGVSKEIDADEPKP